MGRSGEEGALPWEVSIGGGVRGRGGLWRVRGVPRKSQGRSCGRDVVGEGAAGVS